MTCPILFIHGQRDNLIPYSHTLKLKEECKCPYEIIFPEEMDHNLIEIKKDLAEPMENFLIKHTDYYFQTTSNLSEYIIPEKFMEVPKNIADEFKE